MKTLTASPHSAAEPAAATGALILRHVAGVRRA